ncbi:hypothetical protein ACFFRR_009516 [Megaselia abdita]
MVRFSNEFILTLWNICFFCLYPVTVKAITLYQDPNLPTPNYFHIHNATDTLENGTLKPNESIAVVEIGRKSTTVGNGHQLPRGDPTTVVYATSLPTPTSPAPTSKPKGKVDGKILNSSSEQHIVKVNADSKQENVPSYVFYSNVRKQQPQPIEQKSPQRNNSIFAYLAEKRRNQQTLKGGNSRPTGLVMTRPSQNPRYRTVENVLPLNHKAEKYQSTEHQPEVIDPNEQKISSQSQLPPPPYLHYHTANAFMRPPVPPLPPYPMRNNFPIHPMTVTDFEKILNLLTIRYLLKRKIFDYRRMYEPHQPFEPSYYHQHRHNPYLPLGSERFEQQQQQHLQQSQNQPPESENQPVGFNEPGYRRNSALPADVREQLLYRLLMLTLEYDPVVSFEQSANIPQNHNPNYDYYNSNYGQSFPLPQNNPPPLTGPGAGPGPQNNNIYYAASSSNNHNTNHYGNGNKPVRSVQILGEEAR